MTARRHRLRGHRRSTLVLIVVGVSSVLFLVGSVLIAQLGRDAAQTQTAVVEDQRDATAAQASDLAAQIQLACASGALQGPVCEQAAQVRAEPVPGAPGLPGADGAPGRDGRDGLPGTPGVPGLNGTNGVDGKEGTPGVPGADGATGPGGPAGADGAPGQDGVDGQDGKPPAGFTFTDADGLEQTCTRDPASPNDAATYTCTSTATGGGPSQLRLTAYEQ